MKKIDLLNINQIIIIVIQLSLTMRIALLLGFIALVWCQQNIPIPGIEMLGVAIDPITYQKGISIFEPSTKCIYDNTYQVPCHTTITEINQTTVAMKVSLYDKLFDFNDDDYHCVNTNNSFHFSNFKAKGIHSPSVMSNVQMIENLYTNLIKTEAEFQLFEIEVDHNAIDFVPYLTGIMKSAASAYQKYDTEEFNMWVDRLIFNFEPGVIVKGTVGAKLMQMTWIDFNYYHNTDKIDLQQSAIDNFMFKGMFDDSDNQGIINKRDHTPSTANLGDYQSNIKNYTYHSYGGHYHDSISISDWEDSVYNNPIFLDYTIDMSLFWLQPEAWPNLSPDAVNAILQKYIDGYNLYFGNNTNSGCTDPYGKNFKLEYNFDDGSCDYNYKTNSNFMGQFEYCQGCFGENPCPWDNSMKYYQVNNNFTNNLSCPSNTMQEVTNFTYDINAINGVFTGKWRIVFGDCYSNQNNSMAFSGPTDDDGNCPPGYYNFDKLCFGYNLPSGYFGGIFRWFRQWTHPIISPNGQCLTPNPLITIQDPDFGYCTCQDDESRIIMQRDHQGDYRETWNYIEVLCWNPPPFMVWGNNTGNFSNYKDLSQVVHMIIPPYQNKTSHKSSESWVYALVPCLVVICICGIFLGVSWGIILKDRNFYRHTEEEVMELQRIDKEGEVID